MKAKVAPQLPKGFTAVTGGGGNSVEWKKGVVVTGVVLEVKDIQKKDPKKGEKPTTRIMRVKTKDGEVGVWEKAALAGLFDKARKGKIVYIEHIGMGKAKKGQSAPNLFVAGIK
jgi:hypothetical protein